MRDWEQRSLMALLDQREQAAEHLQLPSTKNFRKIISVLQACIELAGLHCADQD